MITLQTALNSNLVQWLLLIAGVALALAAHTALWRLVARRRRTEFTTFWRLANRLRRPSRLFTFVAALTVLVPALDISRAGTDWLEGIAVAVLVAIFGWTVLVAVDFLIERALGKLSLDNEEDITARKHVTQLRVLRQTARILIVILTAALVLSTFESVRDYGVSLFASAGAAGLVLGFAARPVLANLIAGIQIALTQPIRIGDVVIVEDEWGWIEEINATYVVIRIWDWRRLVVPLSFFIEQPFQNWTREQSSIIGAVTWYLDYTIPVPEMREKLHEIVAGSSRWDGNVVNLQVIETDRDTMHIRGLMSARNSPTAWDLRCEVREAMLHWLQATYPESLPRMRGEMSVRDERRGDA
ncbi:mechanosensitive ion channel [Mesobaculum littorinae]|uniref:Mechanosensitive ion channel n=1 Tax=Mesobaculum littorinae TaxID=2486419 RepID=A0A438AKN2_9RHOB|nr:mechanosensitive ion channel domain-containing protein [Mesobaculum littorinae]RVV99194.1 mechanosensitive ion channel [Mesobaculum littorinae]